MPGMEARAPERTATRRGVARVTDGCPRRRLAYGLKRVYHLPPQGIRQPAIIRIIESTNFRRDGEPRGNGQAEARHLGEICSLAAEERDEIRAPFGRPGTEEIDPLGARPRISISLRACAFSAGDTYPMCSGRFSKVPRPQSNLLRSRY